MRNRERDRATAAPRHTAWSSPWLLDDASVDACWSHGDSAPFCQMVREREARSVLSCHTECEWTSNLYILPTYQRICAFFCCCCCRSARWRAFIFAALTTFLAHNPFIIIKTDAQNAGMAWVSACADEEMCQEPAAGSNNVYSSPFLHFVFFFCSTTIHGCVNIFILLISKAQYFFFAICLYLLVVWRVLCIDQLSEMKAWSKK